jgi:hypothetical protein
VAGWFVAAVTGDAIRSGIRMVEASRQPDVCAVAGGTLSLEVVGRPVIQVAGLAVVPNRRVVEAGRLPGVGAVTRGALSIKMICRLIHTVTILAVDCPSHLVIEICRLPGSCAMTG